MIFIRKLSSGAQLEVQVMDDGLVNNIASTIEMKGYLISVRSCQDLRTTGTNSIGRIVKAVIYILQDYKT